jgi:hypothetical protein
MALYKYSTHLYQYSGQNHQNFDQLYSPGGTVPWSGIYRCTGCGREVVHTTGKPLISDQTAPISLHAHLLDCRSPGTCY